MKHFCLFATLLMTFVLTGNSSFSDEWVFGMEPVEPNGMMSDLSVSNNRKCGPVNQMGYDEFSNTELTAKIINPFSHIQEYSDSSIAFEGSATGGTPPYSYYWDFEGAPDSSQEYPGNISFSSGGEHYVSLTVTDSKGSSATD